MKQYVIHICYQTRKHPGAPIHEMDLVAHSIQDAKSAFTLWQLKTHRENIINGGKPRFKIIAAAKLGEVVATESKKEWLRLHPELVRSQIYVCPHCQDIGQVPSIDCDYIYCLRCGKVVIHNGTVRNSTD